MANYYIDIIDQVLAESILIIEKASRSSLIVTWNGGDEKDALSIVGSTLTFNFAHRELIDAKFINLFTGNEIRFKVELRNRADDAIIWQGFVVPDQYSEPYKNGVTFVSFVAACGLGRLKGKYLPIDFYRDEKSLIAIFCKILSLTSQTMDLVFNPAIENTVQKDWNQIYIDTATFIDDNKKLDAYAILEKLLQDTLCVCYQSSGRWNIEGMNKRSVRSVNAKRYNINGDYIGVYTELKLLKRVKALVDPIVTMVPPYNMISVSHERKPQGFPATIAQEKNEGWAVISGVVGEIYATDWNGNNGYYVKAVEPNYYNSILKYYDKNFIPPPVVPFNELDFVNLKNKIFVYKYQKMTISAKFRMIRYSTGMNGGDTADLFNPLLYSFELNGNVIFSNKRAVVDENQTLYFKDGDAELNFEWLVPEEGLVDIKLWRPDSDIYPDNNFIGFEIVELKLSPVAFEEEMIVTDLINDEFTIDKEIPLNYSDDDTAFSNAFRLNKLNEATINYNTIEIPVKYRFVQDGKNYSVVELDGANLIKDNINTTYHSGVLLSNLEVIYNYNASEQMVVKTDSATTTSFTVNVYKNDDYLGSRKTWLQWTDAIYQVETLRYAQVVANVIRRMYNLASEKLDLVAKNAVKFDDLILFHYVFDKQFMITNCAWNLDQNETTLTLSRSIYRDSGDTGTNPENIPPIVNAGEDIELTDSQTTATLLATAFDVDGFIVSQIWTKTEGNAGDVIEYPNALGTPLSGLTGDVYTYQIQVTDNDGATATDTVSLVRRRDYEVDLDLTHEEGTSGGVFLYCVYQFVIDPNVNPSFNLVLKGTVNLFSENSGLESSYAKFRIIKNGVLIYNVAWDKSTSMSEFPFTVGYISTDVIQFEIEQWNDTGVYPFGSSWIDLKTIDFVSGKGNIIGLPVRVQPIPF